MKPIKFQTTKGEITIREIRFSDAKSFQKDLNTLISENALFNTMSPLSLNAAKKEVQHRVSATRAKTGANFVAMCGDQMIGLTGFARKGMPGKKRTAFIADMGIWIEKEFRGIGIASKMMIVVLDDAKKKGIKIMTLDCFACNKPAIKLYKRFGFKKFGILPKCAVANGKMNDLVYMYKPLG